jgi:hypothetical protein
MWVGKTQPGATAGRVDIIEFWVYIAIVAAVSVQPRFFFAEKEVAPTSLGAGGLRDKIGACSLSQGSRAGRL